MEHAFAGLFPVPFATSSFISDAAMHENPAPVLRDPERLAALYRTELLDSPPEEAFDRFTRLAALLLDAPIAMISLVTDNRQYFKSRIDAINGVAAPRQTSLPYSYCQHVVADRAPLVVMDARNHPVLSQHLATLELGVVAYVGVPLTTAASHALGTLCVLDTAPRQWDERAVEVLSSLAESVIMEIELRLLARELHRATLEVRQSELRRAELVDMVVHDLRNPLTSMIAGLDLMGMSPDMTETLRADLQIARDGATALVSMVNDILDVAKAEAGQLVLHPSTFSPRVLLEEVHGQLAHLARAAAITLDVEVSPDLTSMTADFPTLRRVLVNLAANALQHTRRSGVVRLTARYAEDRRSVQLEVSDSGTGISEETLATLFEKFGKTRRVSERVSTGLGLPFCKMVVEAHRGFIGVQSAIGSGTTFRITLPVAGA